MTDQTRQITPYEKTKSLLKSEDIQAQFRAILGQKKAAGLIASVMNTVYADPNLRDAEPGSILSAAMQAAITDLPVDPNLGFAGIIPFKKSVKVDDQWITKKQATFQIMKRGFIQLALRTKQYEDINAGPVFEGEEIIEDRITGKIRLNGRKVSDIAIGYFGYFRLKDGYEFFSYMTVDELHAHAKRYSKSYGDKRSRWTTDFGDMCEKTLIKRILRNGPLSLELSDLLRKDDEADETPVDQDNRLHGDADVVEAEFQEAMEEQENAEAVEDEQAEPEPSENGNASNPDPVTDGAWSEWLELVDQAKEAGVKAPKVERDSKTKAELQAIYLDLRKKVQSK